MNRPWTVLSCCMSLDGYLDDGSEERLLLSCAEDFDRVDQLRADCDAILVGAATVRHDDPRLLVRSPARVEVRRKAGRPPHPVKVTVTNRAKLDPGAAFFTVGDGPKLVYCASDTADMATGQLGGLATVVDAGRPVDLAWVVTDLHRRGVRRLMVEGGGEVLAQFLSQGLADELHLGVAPVFVGDSQATRFAGRLTSRCHLVETRPVGDVVLLRYSMSNHPVSSCVSPGD